jgi:hypothetical protein
VKKSPKTKKPNKMMEEPETSEKVEEPVVVDEKKEGTLKKKPKNTIILAKPKSLNVAKGIPPDKQPDNHNQVQEAGNLAVPTADSDMKVPQLQQTKKRMPLFFIPKKAVEKDPVPQEEPKSQVPVQKVLTKPKLAVSTADSDVKVSQPQQTKKRMPLFFIPKKAVEKDPVPQEEPKSQVPVQKVLMKPRLAPGIALPSIGKSQKKQIPRASLDNLTTTDDSGLAPSIGLSPRLPKQSSKYAPVNNVDNNSVKSVDSGLVEDLKSDILSLELAATYLPKPVKMKKRKDPSKKKKRKKKRKKVPEEESVEEPVVQTKQSISHYERTRKRVEALLKKPKKKPKDPDSGRNMQMWRKYTRIHENSVLQTTSTVLRPDYKPLVNFPIMDSSRQMKTSVNYGRHGTISHWNPGQNPLLFSSGHTSYGSRPALPEATMHWSQLRTNAMGTGIGF